MTTSDPPPPTRAPLHKDPTSTNRWLRWNDWTDWLGTVASNQTGRPLIGETASVICDLEDHVTILQVEAQQLRNQVKALEAELSSPTRYHPKFNVG